MSEVEAQIDHICLILTNLREENPHDLFGDCLKELKVSYFH